MRSKEKFEPVPLEVVCEMARNIPCAPWLLPQILDILDKEDCRAEDIEKVVSKDPGLASSILRLANSAYFASSQQCDTLHSAVLRLGRRELHRLTASSIAGRWLVQRVHGYGWEPGDLCKHSICVGIGAELIARKREIIKPEQAYTAGLLHDLGKLALAYTYSENFNAIYEHQQMKHCPWRQAEQDLIGYNHCDIGKALLKGWSYPDNLVEVAAFYPTPQDAKREYKDLVLIVHGAKHMALELGVGVGEEGYTTELNAKMLSEAGYSADFFHELLPEVLEKSEKLINTSSELMVDYID
ncbi:MAG: HDOD domain-containing protein [Verrucomicrobiota bacterium]